MSDENEEFLEDDDDEVLVPTYKWSKDRTMYLLMDYAASLQTVTAEFFASIAEQAGADHNLKIDQKLFADEARSEIETLPEFQEPKE
jgi:hypothetical protein